MNSKLTLYIYYKPDDVWQRISWDSLFHPGDKLRKKRLNILRTFIDKPIGWKKIPKLYAKYKVIQLLPSNLILIAGSGISSDFLNLDNKSLSLIRTAQPIRIDLTK